MAAGRARSRPPHPGNKPPMFVSTSVAQVKVVWMNIVANGVTLSPSWSGNVRFTRYQLSWVKFISRDCCLVATNASRGHPLPPPFMLHLPAVTSWTVIFGQSDKVKGGPQHFKLTAFCLAFHSSPFLHSDPAHNIIRKLSGIGSVYFGMVHCESSAVVFSLHRCHVCHFLPLFLYLKKKSDAHR